MFKTLLRPHEVVYYSGISKEFPTCDLRMLASVEEHEFNECLGAAFYDVLKEDLIDYSGTSQYNNSTVYSIGSVVIYSGIIYISTAETLGNVPTNPAFWELAPKFETECYNELWCRYLAEYLSLRVIFDRIPYIHNQIKASGVVRLKGDSFDTVDTRGLETLQKGILRSIERVFSNMDKWMRKQYDILPDLGCFDLYKGLAVSCCDKCGEKEEICKCTECDKSMQDGFTYSFG